MAPSSLILAKDLHPFQDSPGLIYVTAPERSLRLPLTITSSIHALWDWAQAIKASDQIRHLESRVRQLGEVFAKTVSPFNKTILITQTSELWGL
jgi:hypothetical protein